MKRFITLILLVLGTVSWAHAQRTVSGTVTDDTGEALIGASIIADGTSTGTITDIDGSFSLSVPEGTTNLVASYTGYADINIPLGASNNYSVVLEESASDLDLIVVSATGLNRNARDVTYANQTVGADELLSAPNKNTLEALRGKVAGVKLSTASGSVGASTRIVLRGEGSLTGNNNALIVVDGIVIDNETTAGGDESASTGFADYGNRFNDINPDDIESVTVLKGPSATSLYGSRGASGVLLITTKKGQAGKMKVGFNSTTSWERAYVLLQRQDQYGQGFGLPFATTPSIDSGENWSWGPAFDGVVRPWTSPVDSDGDGDLEYLSRPFSAVPDQLENFFQQGVTRTNSINLSGGTEKLTFYTSYSNTDQEGILDNTDYARNTIKFAATANLTERLKSNFSVSYANVNQNTAQEGSRPFEGQNAYANAVQAPVNIPYNELRDYNSPFHDFNGYYGSFTSNPYFILNNFINNGKIDNVLGNFETSYKIAEGLSVTGRVGANIVNGVFTTATPQYQYNPHFVWADNLETSLRSGRSNSPGSVVINQTKTNILDATAIVNYSTGIEAVEGLTLDLTGGFNSFTRTFSGLEGASQGGIVVPEWYHTDNSVGPALSEVTNPEKRRLNGLFGNAQFGWKDRIFVEYSARNDWSSTLPEESNDFFYQSVGGSIVLTEFMENQNENIEFIKLRGSIGTTGKDADPFGLQSTFIGNPVLQALANGHDITFPLNGQPGFTLSNQIGNPDLKPELTRTFEIGLDATLLKEKINIAYTYYNSNHTNQLVSVSLPHSSGFSNTIRNLGRVTNQGHELALNLSPIKGLVRGFNWDLNFLWSKNTNEVLEILDPEVENEELVLGSFGNINVIAKEGFPYGTFSGPIVATTESGQTIVDAQGLPTLTDEDVQVGSYQPDYIMSIGSNVSFKGFTANVLFDFKQGGSFVSYTKDLTEFNGTSLTSLENNREAFVVPNSVVNTAEPGATPVYEPNTTETNQYDFLRVQPFSDHVIDASFVKLRELGLTYQIPTKTIKQLPVQSISVGLFAKNLKFWLPDENIWADPEVSGPALTGNAQGIETTQTPTSRSFGFNVSVQF